VDYTALDHAGFLKNRKEGLLRIQILVFGAGGPGLFLWASFADPALMCL
jgi:hypothetical protein